MASRRKGRILAFQALYSWDALNSPPVIPDMLLDFTWVDNENIDEELKAFSRLLILGTIENILEIDDMIKKHLRNWEIERLNRVDLAVLRMSIYSLIYQNDLAPSIVIDEAIGISKEFGQDDSYRFINGLLDNVRKNIENTIS